MLLKKREKSLILNGRSILSQEQFAALSVLANGDFEMGALSWASTDLPPIENTVVQVGECRMHSLTSVWVDSHT